MYKGNTSPDHLVSRCYMLHSSTARLPLGLLVHKNVSQPTTLRHTGHPFSSAPRRATTGRSLMGSTVGFISWSCPPLWLLRLSAPVCDCDLGLAVLEPPRGLDVLRGGIHVEEEFARLLEVVGTFSAEHLAALVTRIVYGGKCVTAVRAREGGLDQIPNTPKGNLARDSTNKCQKRASGKKQQEWSDDGHTT